MAEMSPTLALGTVQWGLPYGIANRDGQPSREVVRQMMDLAFSAGVDLLDTARAYGESEAVIGRLLSDSERAVRVVTKLAPDVWQPGISTDVAVARARASIEASLQSLRAERLDTLLLHRAEHQTCCDGAIWAWLKSVREEGRIGKLGISVATPDQAMNTVHNPEVEVMQVATSILDQRLVRRGFFEAAARIGMEIHIRSIYLQGVAFLDTDALPAHLVSITPQLYRIAEMARCLGLAPGHVWLLYGRSLPVARLVLGSETVSQLESNLAGFDAPIPSEVTELAAQLPLAPDNVLDPSRWPR